MPSERIKRLDALGFMWVPIQIIDPFGLDALIKFKKHEGHCLVPSRHIEEGFALGQWVRVQRRRKASMPPQQKK